MDNQGISNTVHRFLDEAGDTSFYGKNKTAIIGTVGVSKCFIVGSVIFREPIELLRKKIFELQNHVINNPYFDVISVRRKKKNEWVLFSCNRRFAGSKEIVAGLYKRVGLQF